MECDAPAGHIVGWVTCDDLRECRLAAPVWAHQRVYLPAVDGQVDTTEDGLSALLCDIGL
ncbi:MAG: hypothetical protein J07HX64_00514 [halophilic archaeon J07HX64]|nr:MAG: hypothetical protein J07HX64_00514 [halophilic archaeon J07HX64]